MNNDDNKKGLGGVDFNQTSLSEDGQLINNSVMQNLVPQEILDSFNELKTYTHNMNKHANEIFTASTTCSFEMNTELENIEKQIQLTDNKTTANKIFLENVRESTEKLTEQMRLIKLMNDTPLPNVIDDQVFPKYFVELITKQEQELENLRKGIDNAETKICDLTNSQKNVTTQHLITCTKNIYEIFLELSDRAYKAHQKVEALKKKMNMLPDTSASTQSADGGC